MAELPVMRPHECVNCRGLTKIDVGGDAAEPFYFSLKGLTDSALLVSRQ